MTAPQPTTAPGYWSATLRRVLAGQERSLQLPLLLDAARLAARVSVSLSAATLRDLALDVDVAIVKRREYGVELTDWDLVETFVLRLAADADFAAGLERVGGAG